jgi:hypothetical protein
MDLHKHHTESDPLSQDVLRNLPLEATPMYCFNSMHSAVTTWWMHKLLKTDLHIIYGTEPKHGKRRLKNVLLGLMVIIFVE